MVKLRAETTRHWVLAVLVFLSPQISRAQNEMLPYPKAATPAPTAATQPTGYRLNDLIQIGLQENPALRSAGLAIDVARGQALQVGLYPNPTVRISGEEINPGGGIHTLPQVSQQIVTAGKLQLERSAARRGVEQAALKLLQQRYSLLADVRRAFYEVLGLQSRATVLQKQVKILDQSFQIAEKLRKGKQIAELDVLPFEVDLQQLRAKLQATEREYIAGWQQLISDLGAPFLPYAPLQGSLLAPLPDYDLEATRRYLLETHPAIQSARIGIARAETALRRAEVQKIPDVTLSAAYQRNYNDFAHQGAYSISVPIPVFNRNQGNVMAAKAKLGQAILRLKQTENSLLKELALAFGRYSADRQRAERYRKYILPKAERAYELSLKAFRGGQFEYLRVIQSQQAVVNANLLYIQSLTEAWKAAADISGLMLEEQWPRSAAVVPKEN